MSALREKESADYDLERFIEMFDTAMMSNDPRIKQALRQLMMMVILTDSGDHESKQRRDPGPLQEMFDDLKDLRRRVHDIERRMLATFPRESEHIGPRGYNIGGQGSSPHPQWPGQTTIEKWNLHGNDPWTLNKTTDKGF